MSPSPLRSHMCADSPCSHEGPEKRVDFLQTNLHPPRLLGQVSGFVWRQMVDRHDPGCLVEGGRGREPTLCEGLQ